MEFAIRDLAFARHLARQINGIEVYGTQEFIARTQESLALLYPLPEFAVIRDHVVVIRQARRSGMKAWLPKPTFMVGKPTWQHSALWYAGAIAHDAYHAKLYRDGERARISVRTDPDTWTGAAAERRCLEFQCRVLHRLDADQELLRYVETCRDN
ncbi:MAG TPA: hypothetical protein VNT76_20435, partial [Candidatus Binatus sp.]|nr:hypothetical protein [Candidatus Binatus sp.]